MQINEDAERCASEASNKVLELRPRSHVKTATREERRPMKRKHMPKQKHYENDLFKTNR